MQIRMGARASYIDLRQQAEESKQHAKPQVVEANRAPKQLEQLAVTAASIDSTSS
jgi:hypothetical protein